MCKFISVTKEKKAGDIDVKTKERRAIFEFISRQDVT